MRIFVCKFAIYCNVISLSLRAVTGYFYHCQAYGITSSYFPAIQLPCANLIFTFSSPFRLPSFRPSPLCQRSCAIPIAFSISDSISLQMTAFISPLLPYSLHRFHSLDRLPPSENSLIFISVFFANLVSYLSPYPSYFSPVFSPSLSRHLFLIYFSYRQHFLIFSLPQASFVLQRRFFIERFIMDTR